MPMWRFGEFHLFIYLFVYVALLMGVGSIVALVRIHLLTFSVIE